MIIILNFKFTFLISYIYWFKSFKQIILLTNADRQFKILLANYIFSNLSNFPPKKNRSVRHRNSRAQKVVLAHRVLKVPVTKGM